MTVLPKKQIHSLQLMGRMCILGLAQGVLHGCSSVSSSSPASSSKRPISTLTDEFMEEWQASAHLFEWDNGLWLLLLIAAVVFFQRLARTIVRFAGRLGFDAKHKISGWEGGLRLGLTLVVFYAVLHRLAGRAPVLSALLGGLLLVAILWSMRSYLENMLVGMTLIVRKTLQTGDRIQIGTHAGTVRAIHLTQIQLQKSDGAYVLIPNRLLDREVLTIAREKNTVSTSVHFLLEQEPTRALLEQVRQVTLLSPYRAPRSHIEVTCDSSIPLKLTIQMQTWSEKAARAAAEQLEASLRAILK